MGSIILVVAAVICFIIGIQIVRGKWLGLMVIGGKWSGQNEESLKKAACRGYGSFIIFLGTVMLLIAVFIAL